jgi:DNA-binding response OmpR family regulator
MNAKILIVDDEADVLDLLSLTLRNAGFNVITAQTGSIALTKARTEAPNLIILDLMLPEMSGTEICKTLKKDPATSSLPILMLTAKSEEVDKIVGLELGADDYVTKPFSPRELLLRIKAILRRGLEKTAATDRMQVGDIVIDRARHECLIKGKLIELTATEFKLLAILMERRGRVQARDRLLNDVWSYESVIDTRTVDTHVRRLREKMGKLANTIETVRGVGYRMAEKIP